MQAPGVAQRADVDARVRALMADGDFAGVATQALRSFGPEIIGFLSQAFPSDADVDEVFGLVSERLWRSLETFRWQCSLRTWVYVLARRESTRFRRGTRRHVVGRERISEFAEVMAAVRSEARSTTREDRREKIVRLREELSVEDRELLTLRVDRELSWDEIALVFLADSAACSPEVRRREAARLRKRFQLVRDRIAHRAREEGLLRDT